MSSISFKDYFSGHAAAYAKARPQYPDSIFAWLAEASPSAGAAWEAGCGNGQATEGLAKHFRTVLATDASADQIQLAPVIPNVSFQTAAAEQSPEGQFDLAFVAQAAHWFDLDGYFTAVDAVLNQAGILALCCYGKASISPRIDAVVEQLYAIDLANDWPPERRHIESGYRHLALPYPEISTPRFSLDAAWSVDAFLAYLRSWSAVQRHIRRTSIDPVSHIENELRSLWNDSTRLVKWPISMRVCKKSSAP